MLCLNPGEVKILESIVWKAAIWPQKGRPHWRNKKFCDLTPGDIVTCQFSDELVADRTWKIYFLNESQMEARGSDKKRSTCDYGTAQAARGPPS